MDELFKEFERPPPLANGTRVGKYEITSHLGSGGFSYVYHARDTETGSMLGLKILRSDAPVVTHDTIKWEAEIGKIIGEHPNIVAVYGAGEENGLRFLSMEFVEGKNLEDLVNGKKLAVKTALETARDVALALAHIHGKQVIHCDVKPKNVLVGQRTKLFDFGQAYRSDLGLPTYDGNTIVGTLHYVAPEIFKGNSPSARSDIFSLGATLYQSLTGLNAFEGAGERDTISKILSEPPAPIKAYRQDVPAPIENICLKALEKNPDNRHQSAAAFAADVELALQGLQGAPAE
ncbi:MAG TPA: serine/threonine-protein kinase [Candidatus Nanoarchaeia archaeon]|nr:serine/threonine-protein kinase [Candidatus Nanoarchaeia archaeon]